MIEAQKTSKLKHLALIAVFAFLAMLPMFLSGITTGNDFFHHFQLATEMRDSLESGEIYPSVASKSSQGFGSPVVRFYPPLSYYLLAVLSIVLGNWYYAAFTTFYLIFFFSGLGVFLWAREQLPDKHSLLAAALYIFTPFHLNEIYNNYLYAEFSASAVIPFCFWFITKICRDGKLSDVLGLSIAYSILILTHLPTTVICSLTFALYSLLNLEKKDFIKTSLKLASAVLVALAASSFFWLRMITELNWVNLSVKSFYGGQYDYRNNFLLRLQNIINFLDDPLVLWLGELMLFCLILISIPSLILLIKSRKTPSKFNISLAIVITVSIFMLSPFSKIIWEQFSFLQNLQFPWRWLSVTSIFTAVFAASGIIWASDLMKEKKSNAITISLGIILTIFFFTSVFITRQALFISQEKFQNQMQNIASKELDKFWRTIWTSEDYPQSGEKVSVENRNFEIAEWSSTSKTIKINEGNPNYLTLNIFYYPHWRAFTDGKDTTIERTSSGAMQISLPGKSTSVVFKFEEPFWVRFASLISILAWLFLVISLTIISILKVKKNGLGSQAVSI